MVVEEAIPTTSPNGSGTFFVLFRETIEAEKIVRQARRRERGDKGVARRLPPWGLL